MTSLDVSVTLRGPLFTKDVRAVVEAAIVKEVFEKATAIIEVPSARARKRLGFRRNKLRHTRSGLVLDEFSTVAGPESFKKPKPLHPRGRGTGTPRPGWQEKVRNYNPRRSGKTWASKNINRLKYALPNQARATGKRIAAELGGA